MFNPQSMFAFGFTMLLHDRPPVLRIVRRAVAGYSIACRTMNRMEEESIRVVQKQLELYNARNVDEFMPVFADDVLVYDGWTGTLFFFMWHWHVASGGFRCQVKDSMAPQTFCASLPESVYHPK